MKDEKRQSASGPELKKVVADSRFGPVLRASTNAKTQRMKDEG